MGGMWSFQIQNFNFSAAKRTRHSMWSIFPVAAQKSEKHHESFDPQLSSINSQRVGRFVCDAFKIALLLILMILTI